MHIMLSEPNRQLPWSLPVDAVARAYETDARTGLTEHEGQKRYTTFGRNTIMRSKETPAIIIFFRQLASPLIVILAFAFGVTIFLHEPLNATIILLAILVNAVLGFYQEHKAARAIADLHSYIEERTRIIREGRERDIDAGLVVPGDIVHITHGMRVPADLRLISTEGLLLDEAILTGESLPVAKHTEPLSEATILAERTNIAFAGTLVVEGTGLGVAIATGRQSEIGKLAALVAETRAEKTPLQKAVGSLAWLISLAATIIVAMLFSLGISQGVPVFEMLLVSVAVVVGAVPEALPIGLTAVLAVGVERIARKKGIMRSLTAAETLGSTTVIMTDKTGTMTEAKMRLVDIVTAQALLIAYAPQEKERSRFSGEQKEVLRRALMNTDVVIENPSDAPETWRMSGHALEVNIVRAAALHGLDVRAHRTAGASRMLLPFNSVNKYSVSYTHHEGEHPLYTVVGAPDVLLARARLEKDAYLKALAHIESMSAEGWRLLGVASLSAAKVQDSVDPAEVRELEMLGIIGFHDPIRAEVPSAIAHIERYGVRVIIATGDLKGTAVAVGRALGWTLTEGEVLTGEEVRQLTDEELMSSLDRVRIYARVAPEDKLRIARAYQMRGDVVAMTGDGVNDAPSLKAANIGIAVGSGSDVAKSVADLVLLDDNFNTIVAAIEEGKYMLRNIKKIFVYLMSNSLDEVVLVGGALFAGLPLPLTAIQIIWVNLFTGSLPALAFAFDQNRILGHDARRVETSILDREVKMLALGLGTVSSVLLFVLYAALLHYAIGEELARSILFACFGSYILFVAFSLRDLERPLYSYSLIENKLLLGGIGIGFLLLVATLYLPFFQTLFGITTIPFIWNTLIVGWIVLNVALVELVKWIFYRRQNKA
jgi:Ca2+-transporting ATPase